MCLFSARLAALWAAQQSETSRTQVSCLPKSPLSLVLTIQAEQPVGAAREVAECSLAGGSPLPRRRFCCQSLPYCINPHPTRYP